MAFGVTPEGFNLKRLEDIKLEIEADLRGVFGKGVNLLPEAVLGQLVGVFSEREALVWEDMQAVYQSYYPGSSVGINLDNVNSIRGVTREIPTKSTIVGQLLFGTIGTIIPVDRIFSVSGDTLARFKTQAQVTLAAGTDEIQDITFDVTPDSGTFKLSFNAVETSLINFNDNAATIQAALEAISTIGTGNVSVSGSITSGAGLTITFLVSGPVGLGKRDVALLQVTSNLLLIVATPINTTVTETTPGIAQATVDMIAETEGSTNAPAGSLSVIETPVTGLDSTVNPLDAKLGQDLETDPEYRIRADLEVAKAGTATPDAIFSDISEVLSVTAVRIFFNNNNIPDVDGLPPHSVEVVVQGGDEDDLGQAVFDSVAAGITQIGTISKSVTDKSGFIQTAKFSRPTVIDIWVEIDLSTDGALFPADGLAQVRAAVVALDGQFGIGDDVIVFGSDPSISCSFGDIPGILDYIIRIGIAVSPTLDDNVVIGKRELADFDTSRILVVVP